MKPIIWKGPRDLQALEQRRLEAARLFAAGVGQAEVARRLGATAMSVSRWYRVWQEHGEEGLKRKAPPGYAPRLSPEQRQQLEEALVAGPAKAGYATELWTAPRVRKLIWERFRVRYHESHVWLLLRQLGWTCQKPAKRALERDEEAIATWVKERWPQLKRGRSSKTPPSSSGTKRASLSGPASGAPGRREARPRS
jgi:transposase